MIDKHANYKTANDALTSNESPRLMDEYLSSMFTATVGRPQRANEAQAKSPAAPLEQLVASSPEEPRQDESENQPNQLGKFKGKALFYNGHQWEIAGINGNFVELTRPGQKTVSLEELKELNRDAQGRPIALKIEGRYKVRRSDWSVDDGWVLVSLDGPKPLLVKTDAFKTLLPLEQVRRDNPQIFGTQQLLDRSRVERVLNDPNSKISEGYRWTDGASGHNKRIGLAMSPDGETVKLIIHKAPPKDVPWIRLRNDLAAQAVAQHMGAPELFPVTVSRDGILVQEFIGERRITLDTYIRDIVKQDPILRAETGGPDVLIQKLLNRSDPRLRTEIARSLAFSIILGDKDLHGNNFLVQRLGPDPYDIKVVRCDTDMAFKATSASMDRQAAFGGVINGFLAYFSETELPEAVKAEVKRLSDELNPPDAQHRQGVRARFAKETGLPLSEVEGIAARAQELSAGRFPKSRPVEPFPFATEAKALLHQAKKPGSTDHQDEAPPVASRPDLNPYNYQSVAVKLDAELERLIEKRDVDGIKKHAECATSLKSATEAIAALEKLKPGNLTELLTDLANGNSYAVLAALERHPNPQSIYERRFANNELFALWKEGKLDIGATLKDFSLVADVDDVDSVVRELMRSAGEDTRLRTELARALVTTQKDNFLLIREWLVSVHPALRNDALKTLIQERPPDLEKLLLSIDQHEQLLFRTAHDGLVQMWYREGKGNQGEPSRPALLTGNILPRFVDDISSVTFSGSADLLDKYGNYKLALQRHQDKSYEFRQQLVSDIQKEKLDAIEDHENSNFDYADLARRLNIYDKLISFYMQDPRRMEEFLKDKPQRLEEYRRLSEQKRQLDDTRVQLDLDLKPRMETIATKINELLKTLNLPVLAKNLTFVAELNNAGEYNLGTGRMSVLELALAINGPISSSIMKTILHEVTHLEQDTLIVRSILDEASISGKQIDDETRQRVKQTYKNKMNCILNDDFLDLVLDCRNGQRLNSAEMLRASVLVESFKDKNASRDRVASTEQKIDQLRRVIHSYGDYNTLTADHLLIGLDAANLNAVKKRFKLDVLSPKHEELLKRYSLEKSLGSPNLGETAELVKGAILAEIELACKTLQTQLDQEYRQRFHEVETWAVGDRTKHLLDFAQSETTKPAQAVPRQIQRLAATGDLSKGANPGSIKENPTTGLFKKPDSAKPLADLPAELTCEELKALIPQWDLTLEQEMDREQDPVKRVEIFRQQKALAYCLEVLNTGTDRQKARLLAHVTGFVGQGERLSAEELLTLKLSEQRGIGREVIIGGSVIIGAAMLFKALLSFYDLDHPAVSKEKKPAFVPVPLKS